MENLIGLENISKEEHQQARREAQQGMLAPQALFQRDLHGPLTDDPGIRPVDLQRVSCDDWKGLYIGGKLVDQNHSINPWPALAALQGKVVGAVDSFEVDQEWVEERGGLPEFFSEIPEEVLS